MERTRILFAWVIAVGFWAGGACGLTDYMPPSGEGGGTTHVGEMRCGDDVCGPSEVCCVEQGQSPTTACTAVDACFALVLLCDGPEDCAAIGGICCGLWDEASFVYTSVECTAACGSEDRIPLCDLSRGDADCPTGLHCNEEPLLGPQSGSCAP